MEKLLKTHKSPKIKQEKLEIPVPALKLKWISELLIKKIPGPNEFTDKNIKHLGTSLVVQWLRLCTPNAGSILGQGTRSQHAAAMSSHATTKDPEWCN